MPARDRLQHLMELRAERQLKQRSHTPEISLPEQQSIQREVARSIESGEHVSRAVGRVMSGTATPVSSAQPSPAQSTRNVRARSLPPAPPPAFNKAPTPLIPIPSDAKQEDLWAAITKQAYGEQRDRETRERLERAEKIRQQKAMLDEMVDMRKKARSTISIEQRKDRAFVDSQKVVWDQQQIDAKKAHRAVGVALRADREAQVAEQKKKKAAEVEERKVADQAILRRIDVEIKQQQERQQAERDHQVQLKDELIAVNEVNKKIREGHKQREAELEAAVIVHMREREEKVVAAREKALHELREKMKGRETLGMKLKVTLEEKAAEDERRAEKVADARHQARIDREESEKRLRKEGLLKILEFQYKQVEEKNKIREVIRAEHEEEKRQAQALVEDSERILAENRLKARRKIDAQKDMLVDQMKDNSRFHAVVISDEEKKLNAASLTLAKGERTDRHKLYSPF